MGFLEARERGPGSAPAHRGPARKPPALGRLGVSRRVDTRLYRLFSVASPLRSPAPALPPAGVGGRLAPVFCEICTDVDGVYTSDPRAKGAKALALPSVEYAFLRWPSRHRGVGTAGGSLGRNGGLGCGLRPAPSQEPHASPPDPRTPGRWSFLPWSTPIPPVPPDRRTAPRAGHCRPTPAATRAGDAADAITGRFGIYMVYFPRVPSAAGRVLRPVPLAGPRSLRRKRLAGVRRWRVAGCGYTPGPLRGRGLRLSGRVPCRSAVPCGWAGGWQQPRLSWWAWAS